jgi:hypothetical protein
MRPAYIFPADPPRDIRSYGLNIHRGLAPFYFFGIFFMAAPAVPAVFFLALDPARGGGIGRLAFSVAVFFTAGCLILAAGVKKAGRRKAAFMNGSVVRGRILRHGRRFAFWKSSKDYTATVEYSAEGGGTKTHIVASGSRDLYAALPVGKEISGFYDSRTGSAFFPDETGVSFSIG